MDEPRQLADSRGFIVKPDRDADFYVVWSNVVEAPLGCGDREFLLAEGFTEDRIYRADVTGSSRMWDPMSSYCGVLDGEWDDEGFIVEQRGVLAREHLAAFTLAYMEERWDDAWDLLAPFEDESEVRRGIDHYGAYPPKGGRRWSWRRLISARSRHRSG